MTKQYLLRCECGQSTPIDVTQAGQSLACPCGRTLVVPSMRAVRQLPLCEAGEPRVSKRSWNALQGTLFAVGALLALWGLLFAAYHYLLRTRIQIQPISSEMIRQAIEEVDTWTLEQAYAFWTETQKRGLPPGLSPYVLACREAARLERTATAGAAIAVFGLLLALSSLLFGRRSRAAPSAATPAPRKAP